jgi:hypothetical protein
VAEDPTAALAEQAKDYAAASEALRQQHEAAMDAIDSINSWTP